MSGTSLDGLDIALCQISGAGARTRIEVEHFQTLPYNDDFKQEIRRVFSKQTIHFQDLVLLNVVIAEEHARLVLQCLKTWNIPPQEVDLIASHGQTVFHAPRVLHGLENYPNATLQIGDGDHIARRTGIITVSDFRQKHLAAGGEGAPLALYGDYFLFSKKGEDRFLLNIGGIANFTFLPGNGDTNAAFATDTGPGNTLLDAFARSEFQVPYDEGARIASNGIIDYGLLERLKSEPFFQKPMPKTIGPELFSPDWVRTLGQPPKGNFNPYDLMATLTKLTADTIAGAILKTQTTSRKKALYLSGGGAHNPLILKYLSENLKDWNIAPVQRLGVHGDAKEAVLFALLANELIAGKEQKGMTLGGVPLVSMGKISLPE
ncbi:MAG: anhydro-N-acetylmuramic acid kinase [Saprospiraceae bacterium]|nr:anhydro-N-acetylmuramic acid kinase [Saprospiraceae bacterium]